MISTLPILELVFFGGKDEFQKTTCNVGGIWVLLMQTGKCTQFAFSTTKRHPNQAWVHFGSACDTQKCPKCNGAPKVHQGWVGGGP